MKPGTIVKLPAVLNIVYGTNTTTVTCRMGHGKDKPTFLIEEWHGNLEPKQVADELRRYLEEWGYDYF